MVPAKAIVALAASLLLATCTTGNREPGYAYLRLESNPTTLDPALIKDVNGGSIAAKIFNGLVRLGEGLEIVPDIADSWEVARDGRSYRFRLKKGVTFSSGREVKTYDFRYSFERVLDPETKSPNTWVFDKIRGAREFMEGRTEHVRGIRIIDDYDFVIELDEPFSPFLGLLTMPPASVIPVEEVLHWGPDFSSHPVGTGPFVLSEWLPNRHLKLQKRDNYFDGSARVAGIVYRIIPEELTAVAEFELGNLDVMTVPDSEYSRYRSSERWSTLILCVSGLNTYYLGMNCQRPPFNDPGLRRAVHQAIDRRRILETFLEGRGRLAAGPVPDLLRKWPAPEPYAYDPEASRRYIKENGLGGLQVSFFISSELRFVEDMAEIIQSYLRQAGLEVKIKRLEWSAFKEAVASGEADLFWLSWWADYPDPENFMFPLFHSSNHGTAGNRARYSNSEADALLEKAQLAVSEKARDGLYEEAERIVVREAPWVFFWHRTDCTVRQPWVRHYDMYPIYSMDKGIEISL